MTTSQTSVPVCERTSRFAWNCSRRFCYGTAELSDDLDAELCSKAPIKTGYKLRKENFL